MHKELPHCVHGVAGQPWEYRWGIERHVNPLKEDRQHSAGLDKHIRNVVGDEGEADCNARHDNLIICFTNQEQLQDAEQFTNKEGAYGKSQCLHHDITQ